MRAFLNILLLIQAAFLASANPAPAPVADMNCADLAVDCHKFAAWCTEPRMSEWAIKNCAKTCQILDYIIWRLSLRMPDCLFLLTGSWIEYTIAVLDVFHTCDAPWTSYVTWERDIHVPEGRRYGCWIALSGSVSSSIDKIQRCQHPEYITNGHPSTQYPTELT
ncbi:hypothetical protein T310_1337 [Rasamsonia emersonii CBS 393.64]|uniref:ShKT domain-containing protein n=1 Tax=Rasamsonia emersonii (strain ATCC 16479 / CBS 393.64 / IMI 116815) TaxID=1408163 RepID=A0A0F4Z2B1_RASE3|nr:hypothetical protein T310_1337 [Rasamsonia emersonii CBS 393.64]KKA24632.1 hypothetical protein T310_1337 [Rasamsonia emersonii CBS 393.64]